jgi:transposase
MARRFAQQEVAKLIEAEVTPLHAKIAQLEAKVQQLESENVRLKKDSPTSSKPPSSDIVKPPPSAPAGKRKKRRGGQPNHPRHVRPPFPPEQVDHTETHELSGLSPDGEPLEEFRVLQQAELVKKLFEVTEHRARCYRHRRTGEVIAAPFPGEVTKAGLAGPRLSALFRLWHRRETTPPERWQPKAACARQEILHTVRRAPRRTDTEVDPSQ